VHPHVKKLLELQKVDQEISSLTKDIDSLPAEEAKRRRRLEEVDRKAAESRARMVKADLDSRALDKAVMGSDEEIKKLNERLNIVRNNAEYQATLFQIEAVRKDRDVTQEECLKLLESIEEEDLFRLLEEYGEEPFAKKIAFQIVSTRGKHPIRTPANLMAVVEGALPAAVVAKSRKVPATRVFQALRIAVNRELDQLQLALDQVLYGSLKPGGIAVIISFHSLEDVRVKQEFRRQERWQILTPKPLAASPSEVRGNPRSRTAKLRGARKKP